MLLEEVDPATRPVYMLYDGTAKAFFQCFAGIGTMNKEGLDEMEDTQRETLIRPRQLSPAAARALAEAEARRAEYLKKEAEMPKEIGGRGGREPGRYGDWEVKGMTSDF